MANPPSVVLITFAGRRDRMALLKCYVEEATRLGIIDEWHVWNFARTSQDADWLEASFPAIRRTANDRTYRNVAVQVPAQGTHVVNFEVRANHDAHVALIADGSGPSYEFVLGGWGNRNVAVRVWPCDTPISHARPLPAPDIMRPAPALLSTAAWRGGVLRTVKENGYRSVALQVEGREVISYETDEDTNQPLRVAIMTGYGGEAEWRFADDRSARAGLFYAMVDRQRFHVWNPVYQYYASRRGEYAKTVFLKCDDDIVYMDLDRLAEFIDFRRRYPEYFLVSANVVNNGVCAYVQQQLGMVPQDLMTLEMPPQGFCGSLWESGTKAEALHRCFLRDPSLFRAAVQEVFIPPARFSINFVSWLGADLPYFECDFTDDEQDLSVTVPQFIGRKNAIYLPFVAAHLSFGPYQDKQMDVAAIIESYRALARFPRTGPC